MVQLTESVIPLLVINAAVIPVIGILLRRSYPLIPSDFEPCKPRSLYKATGEVHRQEVVHHYTGDGVVTRTAIDSQPTLDLRRLAAYGLVPIPAISLILLLAQVV